jgi:hypothetical protein
MLGGGNSPERMIRFLLPDPVRIIGVSIEEQQTVIDRIHIALEDRICNVSQVGPKPKKRQLKTFKTLWWKSRDCTTEEVVATGSSRKVNRANLLSPSMCAALA